MRAAVMYDRGDIRIEDVEPPIPTAGELLVEVETVGVCGTDASEYSRGPSMFPIHDRDPVTQHVGPMIPGHEFSGHIAALGPGVTGFSVGDLVVSGAGISCGECQQCRRGRTNLCVRYTTVGLQRNGALADLVTVPAAACLSLTGRRLTADVAALGQPLAIAIHAARRGGVTPGSRAAVIGAGGIGVFVAHAATSEGAAVTVADLRSDRLDVASRLGASDIVVVDAGAPLVDQLGGPASYEVVYECSGVPAALGAALALVPPGGRVVAVGIPKGEVPVNVPALVLQEKELLGTLAHVFAADLPSAMELLEKAPDLWSTVAPDVLPLDALVPEGLQPMVDGTQSRIKTLISPKVEQKRPLDTWVA
jgi:(R,R)-butanediol dehydrogenase / meso-butanediol dehydrogenase / diacetyl reductase